MRGFERVQTLVWMGGLAGLIPFYLSIYGYWQLSWSATAFTTYAWIILAFLCGSVWRTALESVERPGAVAGLLVALGLPALLWLSQGLNLGTQLGLSALGFLAVYVWERSYSWAEFPAGYRVLRTTLTTLVLLAHLMFAWVA